MTSTTRAVASTPQTGGSLATAQRSIHDPAQTYPLWPALTAGCPASSNDTIAYPLEVSYDYDALDADARQALFDREDVPTEMHAWAPLLPPLDPRLRFGVGGTPLIKSTKVLDTDVEVYLKDESRNPTWSHKDRLLLCAVSAAVASGAPGVVVASSGNHGAAAAAMASRVGLPCIVVMSSDALPVARSFVGAYGATVLSVDREARWGVVADIVEHLGYQALSNQTVTHTGHPFGPEGYKTIAYELFLQLGHRLPGAVFVPTGYGELLFGVWKGFEELRHLGVTETVPALYACEVDALSPLGTALRQGVPAVTVPSAATDAYSMACTTGGYRGTHVMHRTEGRVIGVDDRQMAEAQRLLAAEGVWQELSGVSGVAGLRKASEEGETIDGPIVCLCTSSGLKDKNAHLSRPLEAPSDWPSLSVLLRAHGLGSP